MTVANKRLGTYTNLPTGATYDLLMVQFPDGFPQSAITFDIGDTPRKITGIQKVAQMFMKILFTSRGSNVLYPNQGTNFPTLTINANISTNDQVFISELSTEVRSAESQVKGIMNTASSDSASQLQSITILGIDLISDALTLYLRILTKAGANAQISIPFPELDLPLTQEGS